jgi:hypothetical protein
MVLCYVIQWDKVLEKDMTLQWYGLKTEIDDGLYPTYDNQKKPSECQRHMHIAKFRINSEDAGMKEAFAYDFNYGKCGIACEDIVTHKSAVNLWEVYKP